MDILTETDLVRKDFLRPEEIDSVQIDHNTTCNLRCPQCARIHYGELNPELEMKELSVDLYKKVFTPSFSRQLRFVLFCGNYGDAIAATNIVEVVEYLKSAGVKAISIFTNGSLRSATWWENFADLLNRPGDKVCFSIDGLEDTNAVYRRGSNFKKIIENADAFIRRGGKARWDYLVFDHNQHQVEEAQALAKEMGFVQFKVKKTNRFIQDSHYKAGKGAKEEDVFRASKGKPREKVAVIRAPSREEYRTSGVSRFDQIVKQHKSWFSYVDATSIQCKAQKLRSVFLDFDGRLWPCTWLAAPLHFYGEANTQKNQLKQLIEKYGYDFNNLYKHTLEEVLSHQWMGEDLSCSWRSRMTDSTFKLMTCGRTCGSEYEFSSNAEVNRQIVELKK